LPPDLRVNADIIGCVGSHFHHLDSSIPRFHRNINNFNNQKIPKVYFLSGIEYNYYQSEVAMMMELHLIRAINTYSANR
jgi:hypothetical protein